MNFILTTKLLGARKGGGGKYTRSAPLEYSTKKGFCSVGDPFAAFFHMGSFFTMWGLFRYLFFSCGGPFLSLWGAFSGRALPPPTKISACAHGYCSTIRCSTCVAYDTVLCCMCSQYIY